MQAQCLEDARIFLEQLAQSPPCLPYEPALVPLLFSATREDSSASMKELASLVERSQKLAARVLAIANSAIYALESTVTSLQRAVGLLGFREVRTIVMMVGAASAIKGAKLPRAFNSMNLWRHQLHTACIARALAAALSHQDAKTRSLNLDPDEAYAAGLLHDIGKVFLAAGRPKVWESIEELRLKKGLSFVEAEDAYWGLDHGVIGGQVLHQWKLPRLLTDPINWHHVPLMAPSFTTETKLLAAANIIAHKGLTEDGELPEEAAALMPPEADGLQLNDAVSASLVDKKIEEFMRLAS